MGEQRKPDVDDVRKRVVRYIVGNKCETQAIFELRCTLAPRQTMKKIIRNFIIVLSKTIRTGRLQKFIYRKFLPVSTGNILRNLAA